MAKLKRHPKLSDVPTNDRDILPWVLLETLRNDAMIVGTPFVNDGMSGWKFRVTIRRVVNLLYAGKHSEGVIRNVAGQACEKLKAAQLLRLMNRGAPNGKPPRDPLWWVADDDQAPADPAPEPAVEEPEPPVMASVHELSNRRVAADPEPEPEPEETAPEGAVSAELAVAAPALTAELAAKADDLATIMRLPEPDLRAVCAVLERRVAVQAKTIELLKLQLNRNATLFALAVEPYNV